MCIHTDGFGKSESNSRNRNQNEGDGNGEMIRKKEATKGSNSIAATENWTPNTHLEQNTYNNNIFWFTRKSAFEISKFRLYLVAVPFVFRFFFVFARCYSVHSNHFAPCCESFHSLFFVYFFLELFVYVLCMDCIYLCGYLKTWRYRQDAHTILIHRYIGPPFLLFDFVGVAF